jgi:hypothetical protein
VNLRPLSGGTHPARGDVRWRPFVHHRYHT